MIIEVYKWEFVELLRLVGASEILAVARVIALAIIVGCYFLIQPHTEYACDGRAFS